MKNVVTRTGTESEQRKGPSPCRTITGASVIQIQTSRNNLELGGIEHTLLQLKQFLTHCFHLYRLFILLQLLLIPL